MNFLDLLTGHPEENVHGVAVRQKTWFSPLGFDDKKFIAVGDGSKPCVFDHESLKPEKIDKDLIGMFMDLDHESGDALVVVAWAMAEKLENSGPESLSNYQIVSGLLAQRRMVRNFTQNRYCRPSSWFHYLARLSPRAGNTEGIRYSLLENENTDIYWEITMDENTKESFPWPGLLNAPTLIIVWVNPSSYLQRYAEDDRKTGLGG
ncbi:MAG: hypothetical protein CM15mP49_01660 [Actinomycetota bacterium]|nr:MAG: hypothetical protein CM15mP49_01660 [Actinomycetota bacterium]